MGRRGAREDMARLLRDGAQNCGIWRRGAL